MTTINVRISHEKSKFSILVFIVVLFFGCGKASEETLIEYTSDEGRFSVSMPGKPGKQTQNISTAVGSIAMHMFMVEKKNIAYMVAYSDYPNEVIEESNPEEFLDAAKKGAMQNIGGKITKEEHIAFGEDPGRELNFSAKGGKGKGRVVIVLSGNRLYQVLAIGLNVQYPDQIVKKFIDSFEIW